MKSVIVEIRGSFAAALSNDGNVTRIRNQNYEVGQVIDLNHNLIHFPPAKTLIKWASSAAAVLVLCGVSGLAYFTPYSYVSLDVNPSIEYTLNRFDRVLSVKAVNVDGEAILLNSTLENLNNKKIDDAIELTVDEISKQGYFDGQEGGIVIATSAKDLKKASKLADALEHTVEAEATENGDAVEVEVVSVAQARVEEAKVLGVTPGRMHLVEKLQASADNPENIDVQAWLDKSVKEIMKATKENLHAKKDDVDATDTDQTVDSENKTADSEDGTNDGNAQEVTENGDSNDKAKTDDNNANNDEKKQDKNIGKVKKDHPNSKKLSESISSDSDSITSDDSNKLPASDVNIGNGKATQNDSDKNGKGSSQSKD